MERTDATSKYTKASVLCFKRNAHKGKDVGVQSYKSMLWLFVPAQGLQHNWHLCVVAQDNVAHVLPSLTVIAADGLMWDLRVTVLRHHSPAVSPHNGSSGCQSDPELKQHRPFCGAWWQLSLPVEAVVSARSMEYR